MAVTAPTVHAHPEESPDHGINETTFHTLWSGDRDTVRNTSGPWPAMKTLAETTDIPVNRPPPAVDRWNRGDLDDFPATDADRSFYPPGVTREDSQYIADAYAAIFALSPSTRARLTPRSQPLYVPPNGSLLGTVDYRVDLPDDERSSDRETDWELEIHRIVETRLEIDGDVAQRAEGTHTPTFEFSTLDAYPGDVHALALVAEIRITAEKRVRTKRQECETTGNVTTCWTVWDERRSYHTDSITVRDTVTVTEYDLSVGGFVGRYPDGALGLVVYKNRPWLGYSVPAGAVHGVWRFYTARDPSWDRLIERTASGATDHHSPLHPLQVTAYPIETGPTTTPARTITMLETYGIETIPPTLSEEISLDVLSDRYIASYGIATRVDTSTEHPSTVTVYGLVRGVELQTNTAALTEIHINRSELTLTVLNTTAETVTVEVTLRDRTTGEPINTNRRAGSIVINGERINTATDGTVRTTLPRPAGGIAARYEPGQWWYHRPGYVGDAEVVYVQGTVIQIVSTLYQIGIPVSLFLLGTFLIDRITGWDLWPPWRRL